MVYPDVDRDRAARLAEIAKALGDPIRLQLVDVLRKHAGEVCVCELTPLFDVGQPTVSHHLNVLRKAGIVDSERRGLWAYYYVLPEALEDLQRWLTTVMSDQEIRELVRERYAAAARRVTEPEAGAGDGCCGSEGGCCGTALAEDEREVFGAALYAGGEADEVPEAAALASLGCGNPTALAELHAGEVVLDLGSGGGIDVLLSARRVGPDRPGIRPRHDRRDAGAGAAQCRRRRASPTSSSSRGRWRRSRCRTPAWTW